MRVFYHPSPYDPRVRCFVALDLPAPVRNHIGKLMAPLRERFDLKWVPRDQMHLTLAFGGDLDARDVDAFADVVEALDVPPLALSLTEFGRFPEHGPPRVAWVGIGADDLDALRGLHDELVDRGEPLGVPREKRGFTPHVTIGRVKTDFGAYALVDKLKEQSAQLNPKPFAPVALTLYESTLTPEGPRHDVITRRELSRGRG